MTRQKTGFPLRPGDFAGSESMVIIFMRSYLAMVDC